MKSGDKVIVVPSSNPESEGVEVTIKHVYKNGDAYGYDKYGVCHYIVKSFR